MNRWTSMGWAVLGISALTACGAPESNPVVAAPSSAAVVGAAPTTSPATTARPAATTVVPTTAAPTTSSSSSTSTTRPASSTTASPPPAADPAGVDPGTLPQTRDKPASSGPVLNDHAAALWQAIVTDDPSIAMPFFFPQSAYLQVKDIPDPASDYQRRLVAAYQEDIHALHAKLGAGASSASFTGITVPAAAQWIDPGVEYNKGGYWRVYGATLNGKAGGKPVSFPIASMISWRGQWYVVHLNSIR